MQQSPRAYYNENDPYAAQWLRNLISEGLIAPGDVDDRSIVDVKPGDLVGYDQCHFFAGIGGWSLALRSAGWRDDRRVWTGSCPCQPFSVAGKRKGFDDARHLWPIWFRLIAECGPPVVFGEQVAAASQWLVALRSDLENVEYAVGCMPIEAASAGADHLRDRYWFVADDGLGRCARAREGQAEQPGRTEVERTGHPGVALGDADEPGSQGWSVLREGAGERPARSAGMADAASERRAWQSEKGGQSQVKARGLRSVGSTMADAHIAGEGERREQRGGQFGRSGCDPETRIEWVIGADGKARRVKSGIRLLAHGVPARVGKLRAFGNAIDPRPASAFITAYMDFCLERELLQ